MEVPKEDGSKEKDQKEVAPKPESPKSEVTKKIVRRKYWWFTGIMTLLAALITVYFARFYRQIPISEPKDLENKAIRLWQEGACSDALAMLEGIISKHPDYVDAYNTKGRIYMDCLKQYSNAIGEFKRGLEKDPKNKYMLYNLGLAYVWLGDIDQAIQWNQKALEQDPDYIIAIYNQAINYVDHGKKYKDTTSY